MLAVITAMWCNAVQGKTTTVGQVEHLTKSRGTHDAIPYLDKTNELDYILHRIGKSKREWIALAPRIARGTDVSVSLGLGISLARALPHNPSNVLRVTDLANETGSLGVNRVCGVPFIETTRAYNNAYKRRAIPAVVRVRDPTLATAREMPRSPPILLTGTKRKQAAQQRFACHGSTPPG